MDYSYPQTQWAFMPESNSVVSPNYKTGLIDLMLKCEVTTTDPNLIRTLTSKKLRLDYIKVHDDCYIVNAYVVTCEMQPYDITEGCSRVELRAELQFERTADRTEYAMWVL